MIKKLLLIFWEIVPKTEHDCSLGPIWSNFDPNLVPSLTRWIWSISTCSYLIFLNLQDHMIKKLLLIFWEIVPKTEPDGRLKHEMILVCDAYRKDLQHPNEFIRGATLRFLCKLKGWLFSQHFCHFNKKDFLKIINLYTQWTKIKDFNRKLKRVKNQNYESNER